MSTSYSTYRTVTDDDEALLAFIGAVVRPDVELHTDVLFTPEQCERCGEPGVLTVVRVYPDPRPDAPSLLSDVTEACGRCAPELIEQAVADKADRGPRIVVEVAV